MKYKISDLAKVLNISSNTIRRYEKMGYITPERKENSSYRSYTSSDIDKIGWIIWARKYGFAHEDIPNFVGSGLNDIIASSEKRLNEIDNEIQKLKNLKSRLSGNVRMIKDSLDYKNYFSEHNIVPMDYIVYSKNGILLNKQDILDELYCFTNSVEELQQVCIFPQSDILAENVTFNLAFSAKSEDLERHSFQKSEHIMHYPRKKGVFGIIRIEGEFEEYFKKNRQIFRANAFSHIFEYMEKKRYELDGDIFGIKCAMAYENGNNVQYILISVPVKDIN